MDWWYWVCDLFNIKNDFVSGYLFEDGINNYGFYEIDYQFVKDMGLNVYQIMVEWSRIFLCLIYGVEVDFERDLYGFIKRVKIIKEIFYEFEEIVNVKEVEYYREVFKNLKEFGFLIFVILNYQMQLIWFYDLIYVRENFEKVRVKGWVDERVIFEFVKFVVFVVWKFGDLVDFWVIFDELMVMVEFGYFVFYVGWLLGIFNLKVVKVVIINQFVGYVRVYEVVKIFLDKFVGIIFNIIFVYFCDFNDFKDVKVMENYDFFYNRIFFDGVNEGKVDFDFDGNYVKIDYLKRNDWIGNNYYIREVIRYMEFKYEEFLIINFVGIEGYGYFLEFNSVLKDNNFMSDFGWECFL